MAWWWRAAWMASAVTLLSAAVLARGNPDGPVLVYIFAGQSNMVGQAAFTKDLPRVDPSLLSAPPRVLFFGPHDDGARRWGPLRVPTELAQNDLGSGFGPEVGAAPLLARAHPTSTIAIVKYAAGSTSLWRDWDPDEPYRYQELVLRVRRALTSLHARTPRPVRLVALFWVQGESDADTKAHAQSYGRHLRGLVTALRHDLRTPSLALVVGEIPNVSTVYPEALPYSSIVRREQALAVRAIPHALFVSTDGLELSRTSPGHFSTRGTVELGRRLASALGP